MIELKKERLLAEAERIARLSGEYLKDKFYNGFSMKNKGIKDIVTEADFGSEKIILSEIKNLFPSHHLFSEELGKQGQDSDYQWVVDPLDGTINFSYGIPLFGVIISVLHKGIPMVGVHHLPILGETYTAISGGGAFLNGEKICVSNRSEPAEMIIGLGDFNCGNSEEVQWKGNQKLQQIIAALSSRSLRTKQVGAACIDLAWIASGKTDILFYPTDKLNPWDVLAGQLMVQEAGGTSVVIDGISVFSNGKAHQQLLCHMKK